MMATPNPATTKIPKTTISTSEAPGAGPSADRMKLRAFYARLVDGASRGDEGADAWLDELLTYFPELAQ